MSNLLLDNTYLILILPLWISLIILCGRFFAVYVNKNIIYMLTLFASAFGVMLCSAGLLKINSPIETTFQFIKINDFIINFGLRLDKLSLIIGLTLFIISFVVQLFSIYYTKNEPKNYRFFALLNLFNFSMSGLLFSPNLFQMYFFWELVGLISYLLIGFDYNIKEKSDASRRVFLINRFGDTLLISAIILSSYFLFNYSNVSFASLSFEDFNNISSILYIYTSTPVFYTICIMFIIAAIVKAAQVPFYTWLQDAMEAKLPVSALLHSATLVAAGIYLLIRLLPWLVLENTLLIIVSYIGLFTALICSILASLETVPKKVLAYSTSANLGLILIPIGFLNIKLALVLLVAHAFIKSMLFLTLSVKNNIVGYITFLIGSLSLAGILFSGLVAKEAIFITLKEPINIFFIVISFFTAFYIMRLGLLILPNKQEQQSLDLCQYTPCIILLALNIAFYVFIRNRIEYSLAEPFWAALAGWAASFLFYKQNWLTKLPKTPKKIEHFYNSTLAKIYNEISNFAELIEVKIFSNYKVLVISTTLLVKFAGWIEHNIMHKTVDLTAKLFKKVSECNFKLQNRNIQTYNAYAFILITITLCSIIIGYTVMLNKYSDSISNNYQTKSVIVKQVSTNKVIRNSK